VTSGSTGSAPVVGATVEGATGVAASVVVGAAVVDVVVGAAVDDATDVAGGALGDAVPSSDEQPATTSAAIAATASVGFMPSTVRIRGSTAIRRRDDRGRPRG
jgi:hypothetical protein